ncbi:MAG TPA: sigma-70 family RNA polymerase sigma factor [Bacillota bacterium]|nr:sigma-70 family RNA polymerase sigma factor [Bacillota bacterium]
MERNFETFFKMHERRIHYQIQRLNINHAWYDDFYAEGIVALWQAYQGYETRKGNLGTFLNYQIRFRLIDLQRKKIREQEVAERAEKEEKRNIDTGNRCRITNNILLDTAGIEFKDGAFWGEVRKPLTDKQWKWVQYFIIADLTVQEIMEIEGVSKTAVKSWGREVRRKLRKEGIFKRLLALK